VATVGTTRSRCSDHLVTRLIFHERRRGIRLRVEPARPSPVGHRATQLINVPARLASSARRLTLHLPRDWPWAQAWQALFDSTTGPPQPATT
jgi:hypothetical protein